MKLEQQVCSPSQSEKLKEMGITAPSLHQWWKMKYPASEEAFAKNRANCLITPTGDNHDRFIMHYIDNENAAFHWEEGTYNDGWDHSRCELEEGPLAAYNVAELGEMIKMVGVYSCVNTVLHGWAIHHVNGYKEFEFPDGCNSNSFDTEAEARAAILIHLLESNLITTEEINKRLNS